VRNSMPTAAEAVSSSGPNLTPDQLNQILMGILEGYEFVVLSCHSIRVQNTNFREVHCRASTQTQEMQPA
jgi:hypothetical protein